MHSSPKGRVLVCDCSLSSASFYQPAAHFIHGWLVLRLLNVFHVWIFVRLH